MVNKCMFPPELRTMAIVPRWNILLTTIQDTVASHTCFVALYAYQIAEIIKWKGPRDYLLMNALMHDNDETISSDITGPFKPVVVTAEVQDYLDARTTERMEGLIHTYWDLEEKQTDDHVREADRIVAAADKLDALLFLIMNQRMGNTCVEPAIRGGHKSLEAAWRCLPASEDEINRTWQTVITPAIDDHYRRGCRGFAPGVNI